MSTRYLSGGKRQQAVVLWLRHYATSQWVAGLRPDEVNEFYSVYLILPAEVDPGVHSF
jgi:hypothetical protein